MPTAQYTGKVSSAGVKQRGPSAAPIWSIPVIDAKRNRVIVTTGENTSHPGTDTSDAVIALDLDTGRQVWKFQAMVADIWKMACGPTKISAGAGMIFVNSGYGAFNQTAGNALIAYKPKQ